MILVSTGACRTRPSAATLHADPACVTQGKMKEAELHGDRHVKLWKEAQE